MNITLLGGSGFVGTRLLGQLSEYQEHYALRNIDKRPSEFFPTLTELGDVRDPDAMRRAVAGADVVVMLAAEHRDDVSPVSLYYDVNVNGMRTVIEAMEAEGVRRIVFTSSVAVYGLNKRNPSEEHPADPFNHYGKSKWEAEQVLQAWYEKHPDWNINILRPTVIFGERNRGNVYNLLKQISSDKFLMVGSGTNRKSMAYVGNIVSFIRFLIEEQRTGYNVYNYVDQPDFTMNELVEHVGKVLTKHIPTIHLPYWLGMLGGRCFDLLAWVMHRKMTISSVRVKKFCATTQFDAKKARESGFVAPYSLSEGLARTLRFEFIDPPEDDITFKTE